MIKSNRIIISLCLIGSVLNSQTIQLLKPLDDGVSKDGKRNLNSLPKHSSIMNKDIIPINFKRNNKIISKNNNNNNSIKHNINKMVNNNPIKHNINKIVNNNSIKHNIKKIVNNNPIKHNINKMVNNHLTNNMKDINLDKNIKINPNNIVYGYQEKEKQSKENKKYIREKNLEIKKMEFKILALQQRISKFEVLMNDLLSEIDTNSRQVEIVNKVLNNVIDLNTLKETIDRKKIKNKNFKNVINIIMTKIDKKTKIFHNNKNQDMFNLIQHKKNIINPTNNKVSIINKPIEIKKDIKPTNNKVSIINKPIEIKKDIKPINNKVSIINKPIEIKKDIKPINNNKSIIKKAVKIKKAIKPINNKVSIINKPIEIKKAIKNNSLIKTATKWSHLHFNENISEKLSFLSLQVPYLVEKSSNNYYMIKNIFLIKKDKVQNGIVVNNKRNVPVFDKNQEINAIIFNKTKIDVSEYNKNFYKINNKIYINKNNIH